MSVILKKWWFLLVVIACFGCKSKQIQTDYQSQTMTQQLNTSVIENQSQKEKLETQSEYWLEYLFDPSPEVDGKTVILRSIRSGIRTTETLEKITEQNTQKDSVLNSSELSTIAAQQSTEKPSAVFSLISVIGMLVLLIGFVLFFLLRRKR